MGRPTRRMAEWTGYFAETVVLDETKVVSIPDDISTQTRSHC